MGGLRKHMKSQSCKAGQQGFELRAVVKRWQKRTPTGWTNKFLREARAELSAKDEQERREDISAEEMRQ